jgi:MFS family permease
MAVAETVSGIGTWITTLAVFDILVFNGEGGLAHTSGVLFAALAPLLVASPLAGVLADRLDRRRLMIWSQLASAVVITVLIFTVEVEWTIYPLVALASACAAVMTPARQAALPDLVGRHRLPQANALLAQLVGLIRISAPVVAGAILAVLSPTQAMVFDVASFVVAAALLARLPTLHPGAANGASKVDIRPDAIPDRGQDSIPDSIQDATPVDGVQPGHGQMTSARTDESALNPSLRSALRARPDLILLFAAGFVALAVITGFYVSSTVFTRDVLGGDESLFGVLVGLVGVGMFAAATTVARRTKPRDPWADCITGLAMLALLPLSVAVAGVTAQPLVRLASVVVGALLGGFGNGILSVQVPTLIQVYSPQAALGRVAGAFQAMLVAGQMTAMVAVPVLVPRYLSIGSYAAMAAALLAVLWFVVAAVLALLPGRRRDQPVASGDA